MTPEFLTHPNLRVPHGFFTRRGGVSQGPYASLNASLSGGDDLANVLGNRALVTHALGADALAGVKQVHGTAIVAVDKPWPAGQGPEADGLVTRRAGLALGVITADCAPVLLCDRAGGVIGAVHAGWRGAAAGVLEEAVAAMVRLGARAETSPRWWVLVLVGTATRWVPICAMRSCRPWTAPPASSARESRRIGSFSTLAAIAWHAWRWPA